MRAPAPTVFASTVTGLTMPTAEERAKTRAKGGNKTVYDFASLAVGKSIVVIGRTAKQLSTTISTANKAKSGYFVTDEKGKNVLIPSADENGNVIKDNNGKPVMVKKLKKFFAVDCNPETDPEKATARIWREI